MARVLIIEDTLNDLVFYHALYDSQVSREISVLFFSQDKDYAPSKARDYIELPYGEKFLWIKEYFICSEENILSFLETHPFDFYIVDSLSSAAEKIIKKSRLPKEKVIFYSSTSAFRELMQKQGYRVYKKGEMDRLVQECFIV